MEQQIDERQISDIVQAAQQGDQDAFTSIVHRFQNMAYGKAYAYLGNHQIAQDAVQEAFWEAYLSLPKLKNRAAFPGWFRRIVHKQCDRQTRRYRSNTTSLEALAPIGRQHYDPDRLIETTFERSFIHQSINQLSAGQRDVTILFYLREFSYQEISTFLDIPISAVKKRLFAARKLLKETLIMELEHDLQNNKPSNDNHLAAKLQFYPALRQNDLTTIKKIVAKHPKIVHQQTEWPIASNTHYWPLGVTPLCWAAAMGEVELVDFLLNEGADINGKAEKETRWHQNQSPLHFAVIFHQVEMVSDLLEKGADVNCQNAAGLTPLHIAVIRGDKEIASILIDAGGDLSLEDGNNQSAIDWAKEKGDEAVLSLLGLETPSTKAEKEPAESTASLPLASNYLGRIFDADGHPLDKRPPASPRLSVEDGQFKVASPILTTGIKIIDLFSPLKRGGSHGVFTPLSGAGRIAIQTQIMRSVVDLHDGAVVTLSLNEGEANIHSQRLQWQGECNIPTAMLEERFISFATERKASLKEKLRLARLASQTAERLALEGRDVLLWIDYQLGVEPEIVGQLESAPCVTTRGSVTRLYDGDYSPGQEPTHFCDLDGILAFSYERLFEKLRPGVDPLHSSCQWAESAQFEPAHRALIKTCQSILTRYSGLKLQYERSGKDGLFYLSSREADEEIVEMARRLNQYLVQPLPIDEFYSGHFGRYADLHTMLADVETILSGNQAHLPEEAFRSALTLSEIKG